MIDYLKWDSDFFGFKTGLLQANKDIQLKDELEKCRTEKYKLIYVFDEETILLPTSILQEYNGKLVDRKVLYEMQVPNTLIANVEQTKPYSKQELTDDLLQLALVSGQYSRFKLDENFSTKVFPKMYNLWIKNSVNGKLADKVFVVEEAQQLVGMVTLKSKMDTLHIGLIATSPDFQGKGYGKQLINRTIQTAFELGLNKIEVPTQFENKQACKFYEACGFKIKSVTNIYHFWL